MCQLQCQLTPECQHFTWYDERGVFPHTCYLYSRCSSRVKRHKETLDNRESE